MQFGICERADAMMSVMRSVTAVAQRIDLQISQTRAKDHARAFPRNPAHNSFDLMIENAEPNLVSAFQASWPGDASAAVIDVKNLTVLLPG